MCKGKKGKYEVVAGARRLAALRLLAKEGRLAEDVEIPWNVRDTDNHTELSLAENVQREAMNIVDEILSYRQLADSGDHCGAVRSIHHHCAPTVKAGEPVSQGAGRDARGRNERGASQSPCHQRQS